jgi:uridylate kinase
MTGSGELIYKRLLLKLSGEALMGNGQYGFDMSVAMRLAADVAEANRAGCTISVVVGGGNIFRGLAGAAKGMDRATADYMGMLATVMNALAFQNGGAACTPRDRRFRCRRSAQMCGRRRCITQGCRVIVPQAIRSSLPYHVRPGGRDGCDAVAKATQVDGVYWPNCRDPRVRYDWLTMPVLARRKVMMAPRSRLPAPINLHCIFDRGAGNLLKVRWQARAIGDQRRLKFHSLRGGRGC